MGIAVLPLDNHQGSVGGFLGAVPEELEPWRMECFAIFKRFEQLK